MPVSAGTSFLIILAVALTTFATRVLPFLIFPKGKEIPEVVRYLGKSADSGGHRNAGDLLSEGNYAFRASLWNSGRIGCTCDRRASYLEAEQPVEYRGGNDTLYVFDSSRIIEILHGFITV